MNIQDAYNFLNSKETGVLATISGSASFASSQPEAATIGFSLHQDGTILIGTSNKTRKYDNLIKNSAVALVIGVEGPKTAQLQGVAKEYSKQELASKIESHFEKVPSARRFADNEDQSWFVVTLNWLRFTDFTQTPSIFEINLEEDNEVTLETSPKESVRTNLKENVESNLETKEI